MSVIEVAGVGKRYGDRTVLDDVSFTVEPGEIFGIVGANGAGKTTLIECIEGLRQPDEGRIKVFGLDPRRDRSDLRPRIGVQLQESALPDSIKVAEALDLYASFYRNAADWQSLLHAWGLYDKRNTAFSSLSGGQKQRLFVALALVGNPQLAFLDELTTGLDPQARRNTWGMIHDLRRGGVTIVLVTHFMEEAEHLCDRIMVLDEGRVVAVDSPDGLVSQVQKGQCVWFRPDRELDLDLLRDLPGVSAVSRSGDQIVVSGNDYVLATVTAALARLGVTAVDLRVARGTLDEAFIALTGRKLHSQA